MTDGGETADLPFIPIGPIHIERVYGWVSAFFENLDCTTKNVAEFWAIYRGLMLAWDWGYKQVILETDSVVCML